MATHADLVHNWVHQWPTESWTKKGAIDNGIVANTSRPYSSYPGSEGIRTGGCRWRCYDSYQTHIAAVLWSDKIKEYVVVIEPPAPWSATTKRHIRDLNNAIPYNRTSVELPVIGCTLHEAIEQNFCASSPKAWKDDVIIKHLIEHTLVALEEYWLQPNDAGNIGNKEVRGKYIDTVNALQKLVDTFGFCKAEKGSARLTKIKKVYEQVKNYVPKDKKAFADKWKKQKQKALAKQLLDENTKIKKQIISFVENSKRRYESIAELDALIEAKDLAHVYISTCYAILTSQLTESELRELTQLIKFIHGKLMLRVTVSNTTGQAAMGNLLDMSYLDLLGTALTNVWHEVDEEAEEIKHAFYMRRTNYLLMTENYLVTDNSITLRDVDVAVAKRLMKRKLASGNIIGEQISRYTVLSNSSEIIVGCHKFPESHIIMWARLAHDPEFAQQYAADAHIIKNIITKFLKNDRVQD